MADVNLDIGVRQNLLSLNNTDKLLNKTNQRLATGKDVNNAIDNPVNFFASMSLEDRAEGLNARLDGIGQGVSTLKAAEAGVKNMRTLLSNMEALVNQARDEVDIRSRRSLGEQFNQLLEQTQEIAKDSGYQGTNLLQNNEDLTVQFADRFDRSVLTLNGINVQGPGLGGTGTRNDANEVPPSEIVAAREIASQPAQASSGSVAFVSSRDSRASAASRSSSGSTPSVDSVASQTSVASEPGQASQGSIASQPPSGSFPSVASQASQGAVASIPSEPPVESRPFISEEPSSGSAPAVSSLASLASRASEASSSAQPSIAAQTIVQQFAFTLNVTEEENGTDRVLGIQSYGKNSIGLGEHEIDWGGPRFKDQLKQVAIQLEKFDNALQVELSNIATNVSVLNTREEFTEELRSTLNEGSDKLVLADTNEEGAKLQALQTRQQLGIQALQISSQQSQQILRLLQ